MSLHRCVTMAWSWQSAPVTCIHAIKGVWFLYWVEGITLQPNSQVSSVDPLQLVTPLKSNTQQVCTLSAAGEMRSGEVRWHACQIGAHIVHCRLISKCMAQQRQQLGCWVLMRKSQDQGVCWQTSPQPNLPWLQTIPQTTQAQHQTSPLLGPLGPP